MSTGLSRLPNAMARRTRLSATSSRYFYPLRFSWTDEKLISYEQSNLTISDIHFKNFNGVTSGKRDPYVGTIVCSSRSVS